MHDDYLIVTVVFWTVFTVAVGLLAVDAFRRID